jgi:putative molybdopterin biosynthesis protein
VHKVEMLREYGKIKVLADPRRLQILRILMAAPATLTQLAQQLKRSPAWIRHHVKLMESAELVDLVETRVKGRATEKYYRARSSALLLDELILPDTNIPVVVFSGSHDLALETVASRLEGRVLLVAFYVGSLDGLMNLRQGICHLSGAHLLDETGEYNTPYLRRIFPDREIEIVTLAHRTQGLMVAPGNPKGIKTLQDLSRADVVFINRNPGSGTRVWLEREMLKIGLGSRRVRGFDHAVATHTQAAGQIQEGKADVGIGLQAAAHQAGLDFVSLFEERYDLVLPRPMEQKLAPFLDFIQTAGFRKALDTMTGYNTAHSGEQISMQKGC